ncbi:hypothetical protein EVAR_54168_1 [Eumeta japonica]|uniref:Uncharacterized protein n=1 Tax=Eumeta variegata TaxID=151549 RepID=A0A4C1Y3T1_EUMVA|nr:hypothetical protein EVAR_54168_1 [Eumeta japonica]
MRRNTKRSGDTRINKTDTIIAPMDVGRDLRSGGGTRPRGRLVGSKRMINGQLITWANNSEIARIGWNRPKGRQGGRFSFDTLRLSQVYTRTVCLL